MVHDTLEHADAHRALPCSLAYTGKELGCRNGTRTTERRQRATGHRETGQLFHQFHGGDEHRDRRVTPAAIDLLEHGAHRIDPFVPHQKTQGLVAGTNGSLDHLGALGDKDPLFGFKYRSQFTLGQAGIGIEALIIERRDGQDLDSHQNLFAIFLAVRLRLAARPPRGCAASYSRRFLRLSYSSTMISPYSCSSLS